MPAAASRPQAPTLKARLLRRVLLPLGLTWLAGTLVALAVASHFTGQAFDRALLDDAYTVSANVQASERGLELMLSASEVTTVLIDQTESVYYALQRDDGSLIAGQPGLHVPPPMAGERYRYADIDFDGKRLRAVSLRHEGAHPFQVLIAQTTRARATLLARLAVLSMVPQLLLLGLLAGWLWRGIDSELSPLEALRRTLSQRDARDLQPVPVARSTQELERFGVTLNELFERLAQAARAQREFAGNVAHELRTPLAGIRAVADYGLARKDPAIWREQLQQVVDSQARASHLVDQLLGLALADEAHTGLQRTPVRLDLLAESAVLRHLARADAQGVDLGAEGLERPVTVHADPALIEGMLDNLIDNALRYGGQRLTLVLNGLSLSVEDDGPGIAPDLSEQLTQRWAQGPAGQKLGRGAGLGLAIVARYAALLEARLRFEPASAAGGLAVRIEFKGG